MRPIAVHLEHLSNTRPEEVLTPSVLRPVVEQALREDLGGGLGVSGDLTTEALVNPAESAAATILSRQKGVVAGLDLARTVFAVLDGQVVCDSADVKDGVGVTPDETVLRLRGPAWAILTGERTALNFLQHLSGIATLTRAYVEAISHTDARITDTRKTTPGLRMLEKYAVRCGGGVSHRIGLADAMLIKENHAAFAGGVAQAARQVRRSAPGSGSVDVMVEATDRAEVEELLRLPPDNLPDRVLLDNMSTAEMADSMGAIRTHGKNIAVEATGGITLENVREVAETGVDLISVGALTHSAPALDISLLIE